MENLKFFSDSGELINSIPFVHSDFEILDISSYNYNQFNVRFTDIDNRSITLTLKK